MLICENLLKTESRLSDRAVRVLEWVLLLVWLMLGPPLLAVCQVRCSCAGLVAVPAACVFCVEDAGVV